MMTREEFMDNFIGAVVSDMKAYGIRMTQIAEKSGMSIACVSRYLSKKRVPSVYNAYRLSEAIKELQQEMRERVIRRA